MNDKPVELVSICDEQGHEKEFLATRLPNGPTHYISVENALERDGAMDALARDIRNMGGACGSFDPDNFDTGPDYKL